MVKKIGTSPPKGVDIEELGNRENYLLSAAVAAVVWLLGDKDRYERKHLNRRKVAERLQRALEHYRLDDGQIDFYCMRTTSDYDYKPAGPSRRRKKSKPPLASRVSAMCQTCGKKAGTERYDHGLSCGVHCDECFVEMVRDARKRSW